MANENQNTGPGLSGNPQESKKSILDAKQALRELIDDQGDYNNLLKSSLRDLDSMQKAYTRISAKIESLNKGSINVKQVQQELARLTQKEYISKQKVLDLQEGLSAESRDLLKEQDKLNKLLSKATTQSQINLVNKKLQENALIRESNIELQNLEYAKVSADIAKEETKTGVSILENEKKVSKQMGITGNLAKIFADKLGVGEQAYEAMAFRARNLVKEQEKMNFLGRTFSKLTGGLQVAFTGLGSIMKSAFSSLTDPVALLGMGGALINGLKAAFDYMLGIQDQTVKFARAMNLSTAEARAIKMDFASLSVSSGDLFINSQKMVESQMEFVDALGVTNRLTDEQLVTNIKLKDIAGLDLETRKSIAETATITGQNSDIVTKSVLAQVVGLKQATGVSFQYQKILKEASNLGGYLGLSFAKYPAQLTKSLVTVKAMGMELKQLDSIADSFLDFESSISKEFEAQLLTGKEINLNKAREAFLNNDLATAAQEITSQVGSANDFLKLNRIQAESLASAFGMSRDQMGEMLKQQELLSTLGAKQGDSAKEQLQLGLARYKNQKELTAAIGEEAYQNLINASAQEKIAAFIEKIKQSIADFVESSGIIDKIESFIEYISKPENISSVIVKIRDVFASIAEIALTITNGIIDVLDFVTFGAIDENLERKFEAFARSAPQKIRGLGGNMETVSVKDNAINNEIGPANNQVQDNTMMRAPQPIIVENKTNVTIVDAPKDTESRNQKNISFDGQTK